MTAKDYVAGLTNSEARALLTRLLDNIARADADALRQTIADVEIQAFGEPA